MAQEITDPEEFSNNSRFSIMPGVWGDEDDPEVQKSIRFSNALASWMARSDKERDFYWDADAEPGHEHIDPTLLQ